MTFKDFLKKLIEPRPRDERPLVKKFQEETELESYLEHERRDRIRALVHEKRKKHNNFLMYKPDFDFNKDVKNHFQKPIKVKQPFMKNQLHIKDNLYFK